MTDDLLDLPQPARDYDAEIEALVERWKRRELSGPQYTAAISALGDEAFADPAWLELQALREAEAQASMKEEEELTR